MLVSLVRFQSSASPSASKRPEVRASLVPVHQKHQIAVPRLMRAKPGCGERIRIERTPEEHRPPLDASRRVTGDAGERELLLPKQSAKRCPLFDRKAEQPPAAVGIEIVGLPQLARPRRKPGRHPAALDCPCLPGLFKSRVACGDDLEIAAAGSDQENACRREEPTVPKYIE